MDKAAGRATPNAARPDFDELSRNIALFLEGAGKSDRRLFQPLERELANGVRRRGRQRSSRRSAMSRNHGWSIRRRRWRRKAASEPNSSISGRRRCSAPRARPRPVAKPEPRTAVPGPRMVRQSGLRLPQAGLSDHLALGRGHGRRRRRDRRPHEQKARFYLGRSRARCRRPTSCPPIRN